MADSQTTPAGPTTISDGRGAQVTAQLGHIGTPTVRLVATDAADGSVVLLDMTPEQAYTLGRAISSLAWQQGVGQ